MNCSFIDALFGCLEVQTKLIQIVIWNCSISHFITSSYSSQYSGDLSITGKIIDRIHNYKITNCCSPVGTDVFENMNSFLSFSVNMRLLFLFLFMHFCFLIFLGQFHLVWQQNGHFSRWPKLLAEMGQDCWGGDRLKIWEGKNLLIEGRV